MKFPLVRPAKLQDLETLIQLAEESGCGITSLPRNKTLLEKKVRASEKAFQDTLIIPTHETYLFCLEWNEQIIGIASIISRIGVSEPFFAYHLVYEPHRCPHLAIDKQIPLLRFTHARKKPTEIGSLFLTQSHRQRCFGKLLSFSRFLFIASFKYRFASMVIAELRGFNQNGSSPFWEAIGRPFFQIEFPKADLLRMEHHACIEEIFPKHPLYVDLLPQAAQKVIGVPHPDTVPAQKLLEKQGFRMSQYVDLFDAGPHVYATTEEIHAVKESKECRLSIIKDKIDSESIVLISNTQLDFRATLASIQIKNEEVIVNAETAAALNVTIGSPIRYYLF